MSFTKNQSWKNLKEHHEVVHNSVQKYINEQKSIKQSTFTIADNIDTFFRELKESQQIRVSLENEIVKLKNIINRQNRQKKEK